MTYHDRVIVETKDASRFVTDETRLTTSYVIKKQKTMKKRIQGLVGTVWRDIRSMKTTPRPIDEHGRAAVDWLFSSQDATDTNGSAACYNLILGWEQPYPETSGYIVPTLYDVANQYELPEAEYRAEQMGEWLLTTQLPNGAFPAGKYAGENIEPSVFNTGQILRGLVRVYQETNKAEYKESATAAVEWLADVQHEKGYWNTHDYNSVSHSYSSRISWPMLEAADEFGIDHGVQAAKSNLRWVVNQQTSNGWFKKCSFKRTNNPFLHTIAYTIRGLLESGKYIDDELAEKCNRAAIRAADRLLEEHERNGILFGAYNEDWNAAGRYYCLTGNAQMISIWSELLKLQDTMKYANAIRETATFLQTQQTWYGPDTIWGGIRGSAPVWGAYMYFRYPNWACKFFIDAMLRIKYLGLD